MADPFKINQLYQRSRLRGMYDPIGSQNRLPWLKNRMPQSIPTQIQPLSEIPATVGNAPLSTQSAAANVGNGTPIPWLQIALTGAKIGTDWYQTNKLRGALNKRITENRRLESAGNPQIEAGRNSALRQVSSKVQTANRLASGGSPGVSQYQQLRNVRSSFQPIADINTQANAQQADYRNALRGENVSLRAQKDQLGGQFAARTVDNLISGATGINAGFAERRSEQAKQAEQNALRDYRNKQLSIEEQKLNQPKLRLINTTDELGNPIQQFVPETTSETYPSLRQPIQSPEDKIQYAADRETAVQDVRKQYKEPPEDRAARIANESRIRAEERDKVTKQAEARRHAWTLQRDAAKAAGKEEKDAGKAEDAFYRKYDNAVDEARKTLLVKPAYGEPYLDNDIDKAIRIAKQWSKQIQGSNYDSDTDEVYRDILEAIGYNIPK